MFTICKTIRRSIRKALALLLLGALLLTGCAEEVSQEKNWDGIAAQPSTATTPCTTQPETQPEPSVDPAMAPYIGTWILAQVDANYEEERIEFMADGTMTYKGALYAWEVSYVGIEAELIQVLDQQDENDHYQYLSLYLDEVADGVMQLYNTAGYVKDQCYFREDYLQQFEAITLTTENVTEYLEMRYWYDFDVNEFGTVEWIERSFGLRFKEGLGAASWGVGIFTWDSCMAEVTFGKNPGDFTVGEMVCCDSSVDYGSTSVTGWSEGYSYWTHHWRAEPGEEVYKDSLKYTVLTGATLVIGTVYVPKN